MVRKPTDSIRPEPDFHPFRKTYRLPDLVIDSGWMTFDNPEAVTPHPGVSALLSLAGVHSVSLYRNRVTLLRDPRHSWDVLLPQVEIILRESFVGRPAFAVPGEPEPEPAGKPEA